MGLTVSFDLNYRKKLWKWGRKAGEVMQELVLYADIAIGNEEDADKVFGIKAPEADVKAGKLDSGKYQFVVEELMKRFPHLKKVAVTLRGSISASHNTWTGILYDGKDLYTGLQLDITHIVDRVGGGDSFMAGLIYGLLTFKDNLQKVINLAVAASCLKHSISGDFNMVSAAEVGNLMGGNISGRISR
jgi:2-dehydro-3-deoxygluconokinase